MQKFTYKAKDKLGKAAEGIVEANSIEDAARLLHEKGFTIISLNIESKSLTTYLKSITEKVKLDDVVIFTSQFSTMISAGLPITNSLAVASTQCSPAMKPVISRILSDVEGGSSLGNSMEKHPKVFPIVYVLLVKAAEEGGFLEQIMERLADNLEKEKDFRSKVKGAFIYPFIVIFGMLVVGVIMIIFVIPKLTSLYNEFNAELPLPTKLLMGISSLFINYGWLILLILVGISIWISFFSKTELGRAKLDEMKLKIPIYGPLQQKIILTEMTRILSLLVKAGIPIIEALKITSGIVGNTTYKEAIIRCSEKVEKGFSMSYSFSEYNLIFPPLLFQMLSVGEETGKVDEVLMKVSQVFEKESEQLVKSLTTAVEPIVMVILGVGVGFIVLAVIMPIYNLTSQF